MPIVHSFSFHLLQLILYQKYFCLKVRTFENWNHKTNFATIFLGLLGASNTTSSVWSAVFAVIILHIALGLYLYRAYYEVETVKSGEKVD